ncbi:tyrosine-type recombinase/integrase [Geodermatophilus sp. URMC 62]|uniref:tyrosine-type recombinase/integrase n=1 Tax=Geodermatophilus sp. URMC 62 TaxID=3423414 RepID=UPI00406CBBE3
MVGPPGVGARYRDGDEPGRPVHDLCRCPDAVAAPLAPRALGQEHGLSRPGAGHRAHPDQQRPGRPARRRRRPGHPARPERRYRPPPPAPPGRRHDAADTRPGRGDPRGRRRSFRAFVGLCGFAGLRLGEAAAVRVGDVDFLRRTLTGARQVQRAPGGAIELRAPKYGSERQVYLAPSLVDLLARHVAAHCPQGSWLFTGDAGQPPHQNTVGHRWRTTLAAADLSGVKLHDLRHFYASGLIASGCDVVTVQRALGHASATTTLNTYSHLWPTAEDRTRRAAEELFADSCGLGADSAAPTSR